MKPTTQKQTRLLQLCRSSVFLMLCAWPPMTVNGAENAAIEQPEVNLPANDSGEPVKNDVATAGDGMAEGGESEAIAEEADPEQAQLRLMQQKKEWAARSKAWSSKRVQLVSEASDQRALKSELKSVTEHWLHSPAEAVEFLVVERKERTGTPQGAALFVPGINQHADWPTIVRPVMKRLTEIGWYSFGISMPYQRKIEMPRRELAAKEFDTYTPRMAEEKESDAPPEEASDTGNSTEQVKPQAKQDNAAKRTADGADKKVVEIDLSSTRQPVTPKVGDESAKPVSVKEAVASRLTASFEFVKSAGYENMVLIAIGNGADAVLDFLVDHKAKLPARGFAMVWIEPEFAGDPMARLEAALDGFSSPLLDIADSLDLSGKAQADERKRIARGLRVPQYHLAHMPISGQSIMREKRMLPYRISGWLQKNAPGIKTKKSSR